ncbi:MAG: helix-turn-helix domain-containing protein [Hydrogenovibrio sp.]|nr:helix-turn-helix domain-containing protein [Hydrogenovibrio sp.]
MSEQLQTPQQLSEMLKSKRKAQALSLEMVSERLKLTKEQLEYFESPELNLAELTPFQRGYLRNYAEVLGVDVSQFDTEFPDGIQVSSTLSKVEQYDAKKAPLISPEFLKWILWALVVAIIITLIVINQ